MQTKKFNCLLAFALVIVSSCSFEKIGKDLGKGVASSVGQATDSAGRRLIMSIRTELTTDSSRIKLAHFLDSVLKPTLLSVQNTTGNIRDSFINHQSLIWADSLLQVFTGSALDHNIKILQASLIGKTKADFFEIRNSLQQLLNGILSDTTRAKLGALRDELLGEKTSTSLGRIIDTAVTHIVDSSVSRLSKRLREDIDPLLKDNVSFVRKNAVMLLSSLAGLAALIILLVWNNRRKYIQTLAMVTKQIHDIPSQDVYDIVTKKIKNEAVTAGLEPQLREVLKDNGLLGSDEWKKNIPLK